MIKLAMTTAAVALAMTTGALAEKWSVTEQAASGIKYEGTVAGGVYTLNFVGRDDGKKNCVFTGKSSAANARVYTGEAVCEGQTMSIRGGVQ